MTTANSIPVFTIISGCWSQVQYRALLLMPWLLMLRGPTPASKGVLLDYTSDWNVIALFRSLRKKHFLVSLPILGTLLISGLTVFSTGLFAIKSVPSAQDAQLQVTQGFDGAGFDPHSIDSRAAAMYTAAKEYNMTLPVGVAGDRVFAPYHLPSRDGLGNVYAQNHDYRADVDVFSMNLDCEDAPVSSKNGTMVASVPGQNCSWEYSTVYVSIPDPNSTYPYTLSAELAGCNGERGSPEAPFMEEFDARKVDWRLWLVAMKRDPDGIFVRANKASGNYSFTSLACKPRYTLSTGAARIWRGNNSASTHSDVEIKQDAEARSLAGVSAWDVLYGTWRSIIVLDPSQWTPVSGVVTNSNTAYWLVSATQNEVQPFYDNSTLFAERVQNAIQPMAANMASQYLLKPANSMVSGTVISEQRRLYVRDVSFGLMTGLLVLFIGIAILLAVVYLPVKVCSRDPGSIAGIITILARSPQFMAELAGMGSKRDEEMQSLLADKKHYTTVHHSSFAIMSGDGAVVSHEPKEMSDPIDWWRPLSAKIPMRVLTFAVPLALIATLEAVYQHSHQSGGIAPVKDETTDVRYVWVYIPAVIMLLVRILYFNLEFAARVLQPYSTLRRGGASADASLLEDQHRKIAIYGFFDALRRRHWALAAAILSVLVSFVLPIAVSGLYTTDTIMRHMQSNLSRQGQWSVLDSNSAPYYTSPDQASMSTPLVFYLNMSYPQWSYQDLALPHLQLESHDHESSDSHVDARVPALRGNLNCATVPSERYDWQSVANSQLLFVYLNGTNQCGFNESQPMTTTKPIKGGYWTGSLDAGYETGKTLKKEDLLNPDKLDCPTIFFAYGLSNSTQGVTDMNVIQCRPRIEQVDVDLRLSLPSYEIDETKPPSVVPGTTKTILDAVYKTAGIWFDLFPSDSEVEELLPVMDVQKKTNVTSQLKGVYVAALYATGGNKPEELLNADKHSEALTRVYGIMTAQLLNNAWETNVTSQYTVSDPPANTQPGTLYQNRLYLVQSPISTRILEGVLAAMVVCGVIAVTLMEKRQVLPKNPSSIAAVASLLAESEMLKTIPKGSEWADDKELKKQGVFAGTFSMGWWSRDRRINDTGVDTGSGPGEDEAFAQRFGIDADHMVAGESVNPKNA